MLGRVQRLTNLSLSYPRTTLAILGALSLFFAAGALRVRTDVGYRALLGHDHPTIARFDAFLTRYAGGFGMAALYRCGESPGCASVFEPGAIAMAADVATKLAQRPACGVSRAWPPRRSGSRMTTRRARRASPRRRRAGRAARARRARAARLAVAARAGLRGRPRGGDRAGRAFFARRREHGGLRGARRRAGAVRGPGLELPPRRRSGGVRGGRSRAPGRHHEAGAGDAGADRRRAVRAVPFLAGCGGDARDDRCRRALELRRDGLAGSSRRTRSPRPWRRSCS